MPSDFGGARPTRLKRKKTKPTAAPVTDAQSGSGYNLKPGSKAAAKRAKASTRRVAMATPVVKAQGIGGVPSQQKLVRKTVRQADANVEKAINRLPTQRAREDARLEARRGKEEAARKGTATGTVRAWKESYERGELMPPVSAKELASAIRQGYGKVGGSHGLQQKAELEITPSGDIGLVGRRKFLPDTRQIVVPKEYKPSQPKSLAKVDLVKRQSEYAGHAKMETPAGHVAAKALDITARPVYAVAGGVNAAVKGKNVAKGASAGLTGKSKVLFGDILRDIGAPKGIAAAGGFLLDVGLDPTTYVTGGAGSVARKSAEDAARSAIKRSAKAGLTDQQAARMAARAYKQALRKHADADVKGATVSVAGREVPGVRKATAKTIGKPARKLVPKGARKAASDVNPNAAPAGVSRDAADRATMAARTGRAKVGQDTARVQRDAEAVRKALGKDDQKVLDAIEHGTIKDLPLDLRKAAVFLRSRYRHINRLEKQAGIRGGTIGRGKPKPGEPVEYVPHPIVETKDKPAAQSGSKRQVRQAHYKARQDDRRAPLSELRVTHPGEYNEDAALGYANRMQAGYRGVRQAEFNRRLADLGDDVKPGRSIALAKDGTEGVFQVKGSDLREIKGVELAKLQRGYLPGQGGRFVVLNRALVDKAESSYKAALKSDGVVRVYDKVQGGWKTLALATPGFHVRNLIGDTQNAYLAESGHKLARNLQHSRRALKRANKTENAQRTLGAEAKGSRRYGVKRDPATDGVKINGEFVTYDQLAREAADVGAIKSGFTSRDLAESLQAGDKPGVKKVTRSRGREAKRHVTRALQNREDLVRLATYISGRQRGMAPEAAAHRAMRYHFDYAQLTNLERTVLRRIMPFYTFSARNIPLQARSIVTRPGKYANYEKARQEAGNATGAGDDWQDNLDEWTARQVGVPVRFNGVTASLSAGLPLTDLNELPGMLSPGKQADEYYQRFASLWSPLIKSPIELFSNYSFFFRNQIQNDTGPLVSAPDWVGALPAPIKKNLHVVQGVDKRTGDEVWKWPGKSQYILKLLSPGALGQIQNLASSGTDRKGRGTTEKALGAFGVSVVPTDPVTKRLNDLFARLGDVNEKQAALRQQSKDGKVISADNPTPEYERLLEQAKRINREIYRVSKKRGDADPYGTPPPVSELSPEEQIRREFEQFQNEDVDAEAEKLRKEFEQFAKTRGGGG